MHPTISVIIPTVGEPSLADTLEGLTRQTITPHEIIVVGSDRGDICRAFPGVRLLEAKHPLWPAAARNRGIALASGEVLAFTDSDCIPRPDWLERIGRAHQQGADVVGGSIEPGGPTYWARADDFSILHESLQSRPASTRRYLPSGNLSLRAHVVERIGGMDETLRTAEDIDWTIRMTLAGFSLIFDPTVNVRHRPARSSPGDMVAHSYSTGRNAIGVRLRYRSVFATPAFAQHPSVLRILSPLLAAVATWRIYRDHHAWNYLAYLPVVYATKLIYCFGAAHGLDTKQVRP